MEIKMNNVNREMMAAAQIIDVVQNGQLIRNVPASNIMVSSQSDLGELTACAPGSIAFLAGGGQAWQLAADGQWVTVQRGTLNLISGFGVYVDGHTLAIAEQEE